MVDMVAGPERELQPEGEKATPEGTAGTAPIRSTSRSRRPRRPVRHAGGTLAGPILHPLATTGLILIFTIFILLQREDLRNRAIRLAGSGDLRREHGGLSGRRGGKPQPLLPGAARLNIGYGIVVGLGLWWIGLPKPILFGVLAAVFRFVPYWAR